MKYLWAVALLLFISFLQPADTTSFIKNEFHLKELKILAKKEARANEILEIALPGYSSEKQLFSTTVTVTSYNPLEHQCDDTPLIDSNNKLVMPGTVAMPKAYREKMGISLGQTIVLEGLGAFTVTGHMNARFKEKAKVDVISFIPKWSKRFGIKENVKMFWW